MTSSLAVIVILSAISAVFANTFPYMGQQPNYDNIPQCLQPKVQGMCLAYFLSFYYNADKGTCEEFVYGGCQGNKNRFATFEECMKACNGVTPASVDFKLREENSTQIPENVCSLPKLPGMCYASFTRYFYNGKECEEFTYGGCGGNANNFETIEDCNKLCKTENEIASTETQA